MRHGPAFLLLGALACRPQGAILEPSVVAATAEPDASARSDRRTEVSPGASTSARGDGPVEFCGQVFQPDEIAVECHDPSVERVDALVALPALLAIDLEGTSVRDVGVLNALEELEDLYLSRTPIESLASVAKLELEMLDIGETAIVDLSPLASNESLIDLRFAEAAIADLSPLAGLETLEEIDAWGSKVADLTPLQNLPALRDLRVMDCPVETLEPLRTLRSLERLDIAGTSVTSLEPLYDLPKLQYLNADHADATMREVEAFRKARPSVEVFAVNNVD